MSNTLHGLTAITQSTFVNLKEQRKEEARSLFILGKALVESTAGVTLQVIADRASASKTRLKMCVKLAEALGCDINKFEEEFDKIEYATFDKMHAKFVAPKVRKRGASAQRLLEALRNLEIELEDIDTKFQAEQTMKAIRKRISNKIPPEMTEADYDYIKYFECCGCGDYPPPEDGFQLTEFEGVRYPVCDNCHSREVKPDYKRIAKMYHNYSVTMSRIILAGKIDVEDYSEEPVYI